MVRLKGREMLRMTTTETRTGAIEALLQEDRRYPPPPDFAAFWEGLAR